MFCIFCVEFIFAEQNMEKMAMTSLGCWQHANKSSFLNTVIAIVSSQTVKAKLEKVVSVT